MYCKTAKHEQISQLFCPCTFCISYDHNVSLLAGMNTTQNTPVVTVTQLLTQAHLVNDGIVVGRRLIVHTPAAIDELQLATLHKLLHLLLTHTPSTQHVCCFSPTHNDDGITEVWAIIHQKFRLKSVDNYKLNMRFLKALGISYKHTGIQCGHSYRTA